MSQPRLFRSFAGASGRKILGLSLSRLLEGIAAGGLVMAIPPAVERLPAGELFSNLAAPARTGLLVAVFGLLMSPAQLAAGWLAARGCSRRRLAVSGLAGLSLATLGLSFAASFEALLALRLAQALSVAFTVPTTASLIAGLSRREDLGKAMGFYTSTRFLGLSLGPLAGGLLLQHLSLEWACAFTAALPAAAALPFLLLPEEPSKSGASASRPAITPPCRSSASAAAGVERSAARIQPSLPALSLGAFAASGAATSLIVLQQDFIRRCGGTELGFGLAVSAMLLARMLLSWPIGRLFDRAAGSLFPILGLALISLASIGMARVETLEFLVLMRILMGIGMAFFSVSSLASAARLGSGSKNCLAFSWVGSGFSLGVGVGPLLTGLLAARFSPQAPFQLWALLCGVGAAALVIGRRSEAPAAAAFATRPAAVCRRPSPCRRRSG